MNVKFKVKNLRKSQNFNKHYNVTINENVYSIPYPKNHKQK